MLVGNCTNVAPETEGLGINLEAAADASIRKAIKCLPRVVRLPKCSKLRARPVRPLAAGMCAAGAGV
eukprot:8582233-Pyramimonas_sp.AAC.1